MGGVPPAAPTATNWAAVVGIEEYTGLTITSFHSPEIRMLITDKLHRGTTVYEE